MIPYDRVLYIAWDRDIGIKLREIRIFEGISQPELVKRTNGVVSLDTIKSLESGRVDAVSREKLDVLLKSLGVGVRSLFPSVTARNFAHR